MKTGFFNKILPLTVKEFKKAELDYRTNKSNVYKNTSYEFITVIVRVIKLTLFEIKVTDETEILEFDFPPAILRQAVNPVLGLGKYYKMTFFPKRNHYSSNAAHFLAFQIDGIVPVQPDEITLHIMKCMKEQMWRQMVRLNKNAKTNKMPRLLNPVEPATIRGFGSEKVNGENEIAKYCRELGACFDVEKIVQHFQYKFKAEEVKLVLQALSEKCLIMDMGLVYEWVQEEK